MTSNPVDPPHRTVGSGLRAKSLVAAGIAISMAIGYWQLGDHLNLENLARQESLLRDYQHQNPALVYGAAVFFYVAITGLSLPGAAVLTLLYGWYFGLTASILVVSFSSTAGATFAFLLSRFLFREAIQRRFSERLDHVNRTLRQEGPFYLFSLRLIPAIPFVVINAVMGLTPMSVRTFWWVSQLGMLPGTFVYAYAGSSVPSLQMLAEKGVGAVFTPGQTTQILIAFIALGVFPLIVRLSMKQFVRPPARPFRPQ